MGVDDKVSGTIMAILVVLIIAGGMKRITQVMDIMVPVMAVLYTVSYTHLDVYKRQMYFTKIDDEDYAIKPMNCPGSMLVYKRKMWRCV